MDPIDPTTLQVRRALGGDRPSLEWVVERFSPLLLAQARYRLGSQLAGRCEPEDVVNDVWIRVLPQLGGVAPREGRLTPVVVRFLSTTLLRQVNNLMRKRAVGALGTEGAEQDPIQSLAEDARGPMTEVVAREGQGLVLASIEALPESDREIVILRAIEQHSNQDVAELLGIAPNTAAQAYRRALQKLRDRLPGSVFDDL